MSLSIIESIAKALDVDMIRLLVDDEAEVLNIVKAYYDLEDKAGENIENDFNLLMKVLEYKYKK